MAPCPLVLHLLHVRKAVVCVVGSQHPLTKHLLKDIFFVFLIRISCPFRSLASDAGAGERARWWPLHVRAGHALPVAGALHALVADHVVMQRGVFPGVGYLEVARAAASASAAADAGGAATRFPSPRGADRAAAVAELSRADVLWLPGGICNVVSEATFFT